MEQYDKVSSLLAKTLTEQYSTSFSSATKLFRDDIRGHIYNIYGLVRVADEIVDTYSGQDRLTLLNDFEQETYQALARGFSTNPIVHAFTISAQKYGIGESLVQPFFESMRADLEPTTYTEPLLKQYIYGSAEVVGLMCLKVFCAGDDKMYSELAPGAQSLGSAYQKVNFLRDVADDYHRLGRFYFVDTTFEAMDDAAKQRIVDDIWVDFKAAEPYIASLPVGARTAVALSYQYYRTLLEKLDKTPVYVIKQRRIRLNKVQKLRLLLASKVGFGA